MAFSPKSLLKLRKTPVQARSQQTIEVILEATAQLLEQDAGASTNRIAERAGLSIGTLYQYFPNREAILAAMAEREQARILKDIGASLRDLDPDRPEVALRTALRFFLQAFQSRQKLRRQVILTLLPSLPDSLRGRVVDEVLGEVMDILRDRCAGRFRTLDPTARFVLTRSIMGVVRAAVVEAKLDMRDPALEDELLRLMLGFLAPVPVATG
jgi:AcrR family transcriptional regulator